MPIYTPQAWHDEPATDTPLSSERLGVMEAGIAAAQPRFMTGTIATAIGTAAKTVTLDSPWASVVPAAGDFFLLTYTSGNNASSATVSINGSGARNVRIGGGNANNTAHAVTAGTALLYYFDGTFLNAMGSQNNTASSATAAVSTLVLRTAQANIAADIFIPSLTPVVTAGGTTVLTFDSTQIQVFTGATIQTVTLPTTNITAGHPVTIINTSTGAVTANASGGAGVAVVNPGLTITFTALTATPTTPAQWGHDGPPIGFDYLPGAITTMPRTAAQEVGCASGDVMLTYVTADKSLTVSTMRAVGTATAAGATPTLIRYGIYSVAANGDLALIGSTPNDTTLFGGAYAQANKALSVATPLIYGQRYAFGLLIVTSAAVPGVMGQYIVDSDQAPRLAGMRSGQTDLPASITAGNVSFHNVPRYIRAT